MVDTQTQTYTGNMGAVEKKISDLTSAVSSGYSGLPGVIEALRKSLYEREKTLPGLESDVEGKITELYSADKRLAERYGNPESNMYIENPMNRQTVVSGQKADIRGEYGNILNLIQSRQNVIGSALDKGLELYKAGLSAQEFELKQAESQWDRMFKLQESKKTGSAAASKDAAMAAVMKTILMGKNVTQPTEKEPTTIPTDTSINWRSPLGQWEFDPTTKTWTPSGTTGSETYGNNIMDVLEKHPEAASTIFSNWKEIFPEEKATEWQFKDVNGEPFAFDPITKKYIPLSAEGITSPTPTAGPAPATTTDTGVKGQIYQSALTAKNGGASRQELIDYITAQGFDPSDPIFEALLQ